MKIAVFFLIALFIFGYFFWDDIFGSSPEENNVIVVKESLEELTPVEDGEEELAAEGSGRALSSDVEELMRQERWQEALDLLDRKKVTNPLSPEEQAAYDKCLSKIGPDEEMVADLDTLLASRPHSPEAVSAAIKELDGMDSTAKKRELLSRVAGGFGALTASEVDKVVRTIAEANSSLPHSVAGQFRSEEYTIRSGDSLWDICKSYNRRKGLNIEVGLVRSLNNLSGDNIFPGQSLVLPADKISIKVWKKSWLLCVFLGDTLLSAYKVGLGKDGKTPGGAFVIESKLKDPPWNSKKLGRVVPPGDPENILGTRWLGFENTPQHQGYGIHGTEEPHSIGKNLSDGCIRLLNEDVEELFEVISRGTQVEII